MTAAADAATAEIDVKTNTTGSDPMQERIIVADYVLRAFQSRADARL